MRKLPKFIGNISFCLIDLVWRRDATLHPVCIILGKALCLSRKMSIEASILMEKSPSTPCNSMHYAIKAGMVSAKTMKD